MEAEVYVPRGPPAREYVVHPCPDDEAARRFPDWSGGYSVRDDGHTRVATGIHRQYPTASITCNGGQSGTNPWGGKLRLGKDTLGKLMNEIQVQRF